MHIVLRMRQPFLHAGGGQPLFLRDCAIGEIGAHACETSTGPQQHIITHTDWITHKELINYAQLK